jgi:hypothetical protein
MGFYPGAISAYMTKDIMGLYRCGNDQRTLDVRCCGYGRGDRGGWPPRN